MRTNDTLRRMLRTVAEALGEDLRKRLVGRGNGDYFTSRDLEDILLIFDGRREIVSEIADSEQSIRTFISNQLASLLVDPYFDDFLVGNIRGPTGRADIVRARLRNVAEAETSPRP